MHDGVSQANEKEYRHLGQILTLDQYRELILREVPQYIEEMKDQEFDELCTNFEGEIKGLPYQIYFKRDIAH